MQSKRFSLYFNGSADNYTRHVIENRLYINFLIVVNLPLGRFRRRWDDNIKTDLQEVGWGGHGLDLCGSG